MTTAQVVLFLVVAAAATAAAYVVLVPGGPPERHSQRVQGPTAADVVRSLTEVPTSPELARWTDDELCSAWRSSSRRLRRLETTCRSTWAMARIAREREAYLDEVERRHPDGFGAWLAAGAPGDFVRLRRPDAG